MSEHPTDSIDHHKYNFVCGLCDERTDRLPRELTIEPDFPPSVRETAKICKKCDEVIKSTDECDGCVWCGGPYLYEVWDITRAGPTAASVPGYPQAPMCRSCWANAQKEQPPDSSDRTGGEE